MTEYLCVSPDAKVGMGGKLANVIDLIDDNVFMGHGVMLISDAYLRATIPDGGLRTEKEWKGERTLVKKGAAMGSGATIVWSITIGENALIEAGSMVARDVVADGAGAGNPARLLRAGADDLRVAR